MKKQKSKNKNDIPAPVSDRTDARVGAVCISMAGHDKGEYLVIIAGIDRDCVQVADGKARKLIAPKKKKMRHLSIITRLPLQATDVLKKGVFDDSFLRKAIAAALHEADLI